MVLTLRLDAHLATLPDHTALGGGGAALVILALVHACHAPDAIPLGRLTHARLFCGKERQDLSEGRGRE